MLLIGLTGSIATGKSTVSSLLSSPPHSLPLIDADLLARRAVEPGTWAYNRIVSNFSSTTPDLLLPPSDPACEGLEDGPSGRGRPLNRPALGRRVFGESEEAVKARKTLNGIVHPAVRFYMLRSILYWYVRGAWAVILDVPLLFESGLDMFVSTVVVVGVSDPAIQMERLQARDKHLSAQDAKNRVASQTDVRVKAKRAEERNKWGKGSGYVLWNDTDKGDLKVQVDELVRNVRGLSPGWWSTVLRFVPPLAFALAAVEVLSGWRIKKAQGKELPKAKL